MRENHGIHSRRLGRPGRSPDPADACVWAIDALMTRSTEPRLSFL
jgi:phage terminase large subunit-like protein